MWVSVNKSVKHNYDTKIFFIRKQIEVKFKIKILGNK